ncbi:MAG TPA: hypothetical protein VI959_01255, partial [Alphaproteobacteria bacterium]|nr:hypothetical protein [Alphaproteobacteria bacterium]
MFFKDYNLYDLKALKEIHEFFLGFLKAYDEGLWQAYGVIEKQPSENAAPSSSKDQSALILKLAIALEDFLRTFFKLEEEVFSKDRDFEELYDLKRNTIQRLFLKKYEAFSTIPQEYTFTTQEQFIKDLKRCLSDQVLYALDLESLGKYAAFACLSKEGQKKHKNHLLFKIPHKLDPFNLIQLEKIDVIARNGFDHTDTAITKQEALNNASYCIKCHEQGKDSCSKGMASKEDSNIFTKNSFSKEMKGCPLRQKISEMNVLVQEGHTLAALAVICIDNPLLALTGHRICNACMKACIFQRQTPVDIPCVESNVLQEVLELNYGFEIYSLLTRWNPLNFKAPLPKKSSGHTVAVVGLGPAGIAMSHYMMQEGHHVIALDGLKIDPLRELPAYIKSFKELKIPLSRRNPDGFGGVMSYGITVRWDKNLLLLVRLLLERRANFKYFSGVALGQNITLKQLKEKGLSHVALCLGAGNATLLNLPHQLAPGIKLASDFLMSLHLNAPYKNEGANLEIELPCLVIGGGLTAIDAATEAKAYYAIQVEKIALKVRELKEKGTFEVFKDSLCLKDQEKLERFILHGTELLNNPSSKEDLLKKWGGVHVVYRNPIVKAPCYTLNHEEVIKALEEGIEFKENLTPISFNLDAFGALKSITFKQDERLIELESKSALLAIGTSLKIYEEEDDFEGFISYYGDMHKGYSGN